MINEMINLVIGILAFFLIGSILILAKFVFFFHYKLTGKKHDALRFIEALENHKHKP